ncbi:ABC transporter permease [Lactonifactor longoviformis]|uniref:ABC transporter permease n=1 Tax=Lactonifactor longoviformis TaxID=341220 RepID=UPI001D01D6CE|nr:FtsX-like permease family protein [Lactonifactor longoviformis]MCB5713966.1 FtsX-like permease family protein [Lactonifactor longoviformis]MCB5717989.1 FtsX-like permease family protein [Lactonifactor longoviformis]
MKIVREYVWDTLRQNKRTSIAIMAALYLMTAMMSCFCGFVYTMWTDSLALTKLENGDWHGELFDTTYGRDLEQIDNYASVSAVLVKGPWEVAQLGDRGRRNYIISRGANKEYWESMPEKNILLEGRIPRKDNELALSKQYFDDHPEANLGDTLTLPVGQRMYEGKVCQETAGYHENESFRQSGTKSYTLVGKLDATTSSSVPAYTGLTYLDTKSLLPDDQITVYLRFDPMRSTYRELPLLAESIGYEKDEYESYSLKYNAKLLAHYAILPPELKESSALLEAFAVPLMFLVIAALIVGVFVLMIHNAFALSVSEKITQLGTLSGIGATPGQIMSAVTSEGFILMLLPLPLGLVTGWVLNTGVFALINATNDVGRSSPDIAASFGIPSILPAVLLSWITVWLSARIPARKVAKMMPVEALRQGDQIKGKRLRKSHITSRFGIIGELAANALAARKRSYRTATISLCLSFLLLTGFLYILTAQKAAQAVYQGKSDRSQHITFTISDGRPPEQEALDAVKNIPGIARADIYNTLACATWVTEQEASDDMETYLGGFDKIVSEKKYSTIERDGKYRIFSTLIGLEEDSFRDYCNRLQIDPAPYFADASRALIYNQTEDPNVSTRKTSVYRDLLKLSEGQSIPFTEQAYDEDTGSYEFALTAGALVDELPSPAMRFSRFTLIAVMPMEHVLKIGASCGEKRQFSSSSVTGILLTSEDGSVSYPRIQKASERTEAVLAKYYGSGDYVVSDLAMRKKMSEDSSLAMSIIVSCLTCLLALIGLSNVWASISGNLRLRSREFAMLKSAGLSPGQLWRLLYLEGISLGLKPVLLSLPFQAAILGTFLSINEISLSQYLPYAPVFALLGYTLLILAAVMGAYIAGGRRIQRETIITAVKNDTL